MAVLGRLGAEVRILQRILKGACGAGKPDFL